MKEIIPLMRDEIRMLGVMRMDMLTDPSYQARELVNSCNESPKSSGMTARSGVFSGIESLILQELTAYGMPFRA